MLKKIGRYAKDKEKISSRIKKLEELQEKLNSHTKQRGKTDVFKR